MVQHLEHARAPGRNDPCPCGSGKKFKRCCLPREVHVPARRVEDVLRQIRALDLDDDRDTATQLLVDARLELHEPELERLLADRYLALPPEVAEEKLRSWWEQERDRHSGTALARILIDSERGAEAFEVLQESHSVDAPPDYWHLLGTMREERGEMEEAATHFELYVRLVPLDAAAWMKLADIQQRVGQTDRALQSLRRAADAEPNLLEPRLARLKMLAEEGRWRDVRDAGQALLEGGFEGVSDENVRQIRYLTARAHFLSGDFFTARNIWELLLSTDPDDGASRFDLALLELTAGRNRRALEVLAPLLAQEPTLLILDVAFRAHLALTEFEEVEEVAVAIEELDSRVVLRPLSRAARAASFGDFATAAALLAGEAPELYRDLWLNLRLDCLTHLGDWTALPPVLKSISHPDDRVFCRSSLAALAAGKIDLADRLLARMDDHQALEAHALISLIPTVRQARRAGEDRRREQVDQAEKQRWALEGRELRRHIRDLEQHNAALAEALSLSEQSLERLLERMGVLAQDSGSNWEAHVQSLAQRVHKDALARELQEAEQRLRSMLGPSCWSSLSESSRAALREGEWLFAAVEGEDRDYGASLLEFARGLERAYKDVIFVPARSHWRTSPGPVERLQDEAHDPSLGPFVRYLLQDAHLTLGSMAATLDRMSDVRRQGVAISLLRRQLGIAAWDERALYDWKRVSERLAEAAGARNRPAHASTVSRDSVRSFREMVLGTEGLLRSLDRC